MPFVDCAHPPANAAGPSGPTRSLATRLWQGKQVPGALLLEAAGSVPAKLAGATGRVESGGAFVDPAIEEELRAALPAPLARFARPQMEWYACRGAFFHNDAHYEGVLFGVWSIAGPPRHLAFPRIGCRLPASAGNIVVFDPFEPHAVLDAGTARYRREDYEQTARNLFLGFEVDLVPQVREAFGIGAAREDVATLSSRVAINPETGDPVTSAA